MAMTFRTGVSEGPEPAVCTQLETSIRYPEHQQCGRINTRFPYRSYHFATDRTCVTFRPPAQLGESCSTVLSVHIINAVRWRPNSTRLLPLRFQHVYSTFRASCGQVTVYRVFVTRSAGLGTNHSSVVEPDLARYEVT